MARRIKKYSNRKLYDTVEKNYVSMERLADLIKGGEEVIIEDNKTSEDITSSVISQLLARDKSESKGDVPSGVLVQLLRKGSGTVVNYAKKYLGLWQSALTMAEDELDKLVSVLVKDKEISESEGGKLKTEILSYADGFKKWIGHRIDQRISHAFGAMNLATRDQILEITDKIEKLTKTVDMLEKFYLENFKNKSQDTQDTQEKTKEEM